MPIPPNESRSQDVLIRLEDLKEILELGEGENHGLDELDMAVYKRLVAVRDSALNKTS